MWLSRASLGIKLNLALVLFFIVLGGLTSVLILYGFNRTQDNAKARSQEGLEELGELALLGVVAGQADYGGLALEAAAEMGFRAAQFLENFERSGLESDFDTSRLTKTDEGVIYDPDPNRITDLAAPNYVQLTDAVLDEIVYSAALDAIVPVLMQDFPDSIREENFDPIAFAFIGSNSTVRYFPPERIWEQVPPDIDVTTIEQRLGAAANPERKMFWRAPYEDAAGKGLVMTVEVPVYSGDQYRGTFQIDLSLEKLVAQIDLLKLTSTGFAFYVDTRGDVIQSGARSLIAGEVERGNSELIATLDAMRNGEEGVQRVTIGGDEMFIGYSPMGGVGGSLAVAASVEEITASAAAITASIESEGERTLQVTLLAMGALFAVALIGATYLNRRVLVRPIEALVRGTRAVAEGDFGTQIEVRGDDELADLGHSFNQMTAEVVAARGDLERQVEERTRELTTLLAISSDVASTLELGPLLSVVLEQVQHIADYYRCSILTLDGDRFVLLDSRSPEGQGPVDVSIRVDPEGPILSHIFNQDPVIIDDMQGDSEAANAYRESIGDLRDTVFKDVRAWMGVPLALKDRVIGIVTLSHTRPGFYTKHHAGLVSAIGTQIAVAIENARLYERAQQLAATEERQRLARELHDSVSQALYGIALGARTARTLLDTDPARATEPVDYVLQLAEAGLAEMRALIFELRPESLETEGLVAALEKQVAATQARFGIDIAAELDGEPDLSLTEKEVFYRIVQEALHNVVKHAHATRCEIRLASGDAATALEIRDDGVGFDVNESFPGHMGLVSMQERAASVGGTLKVESRPGEGTSVRLTLENT